MGLPKTYEPGKYESGIYDLWEKSGAFTAHPEADKPRFSIAMPPPNATGSLHLGHTLGLAIQDTLVRYQRMQGKDVLWLPGTDHAALATNAIMEKQLAEQGTNKHEIGREEFTRRLQKFIADSRQNIVNQTRAVGASCDWSRERYTLDDTLNRCVNEVFVKMYHDGLIYRGHRIVNWDPNLETTVADDEVDHKEETTIFYTFQYGPFKIGTARPETKFGDKYVVMHPDDKRYAKYHHGETFTAEWINGPVTATIIKDKVVDPAFGTGVMTITPWHDHTDFEIAERHNLDKEQIIDFHGKLLPIAGEFADMPIHKARPLIVAKLKAKGLLLKTDDHYVHSVAINSRGKGVIEPQIKLQWFVDVNKQAVPWKGRQRSFKEVMRAVIDDGDIHLVPTRFSKLYFHWIDNLRDWCISRQIWWGHRIPVWYRTNAEDELQVHAGITPPQDDGAEGWHDWEQDPDTLDTWFSSALWTWSTLVDPKLAANPELDLKQLLMGSEDYRTYHPTSVMETGWDILFFWVARMILSTTYATGEVPFKTVYLHGLVRNEAGHKMSKSHPETMIDPLEVIPEFGTDALRLALIHGTQAGSDQRLGKTKIAAQRNFCNKLWNIARFIEAKLGDDTVSDKPVPKTAADHWILSKLQHSVKYVGRSLDSYRLAEAYDHVYHLVWDDFADWYIEASKGEANRSVLRYSLQTILKLTHPFAPFVTEAIWQELFPSDGLLIASEWPKAFPADKTLAREFEDVKTIVSEVRAIATNLELAKPTLLHTSEQFFTENRELITQLARLGKMTPVEKTGHGLHLTQTTYQAWVDVDRQIATAYTGKLNDRRQAIEKEIAQLKGRLDNRAYVAKAPKHLVTETKTQLATALQQLEQVTNELAIFTTASKDL